MQGKSPWVDMTLRLGVSPDVSAEPDGSVEVSFTRGSTSLSLLMSPAEFLSLLAQGRDLVAMGKVVGVADNG